MDGGSSRPRMTWAGGAQGGCVDEVGVGGGGDGGVGWVGDIRRGKEMYYS